MEGVATDARPNVEPASEVTCSVCFLPFHFQTRIPLIMSCGHSFCEHCVQELASNNPMIVGLACPTCRRFCHFKENTRKFPINFVLRDMLEQAQIANANQSASRYPCKDCGVPHDEYTMLTCCCTPNTDSMKDFMGRPCASLICSQCGEKNHRGHVLEDPKNVNARWNLRAEFVSFESAYNSKNDQLLQLQGAVSGVSEIILKRLMDLEETRRQVMEHAGHDSIETVLRNCSKLFRESGKRTEALVNVLKVFMESNKADSSLAERIFQRNQSNEQGNSEDYAAALRRRFAEPGSQPLPQAPAETPLAQVNPVNIAIPGVPIANEPVQMPGGGPVDQQALERWLMRQLQQRQPQVAQPAPLVAQAPALPAYQPPNQNMLQVAMQNYVDAYRQQLFQAYYYGPQLNPNAGARPPQNVDVAMRNQVFAVLQAVRGIKLQHLFAVPLCYFNSNHPNFYWQTLQDIILLFVNNVPENVRLDVSNYFFIHPFENRVYAEPVRRHIREVLSNILNILVPGRFPCDVIERLRAALEPAPPVEPDIIWVNGDENNGNVENPNAEVGIHGGVYVINAENGALMNLHDDEELHEGVDEPIVPQEGVRYEAVTFQEVEMLFGIEDFEVNPPARSTRARRRAQSAAAHPYLNPESGGNSAPKERQSRNRRRRRRQ